MSKNYQVIVYAGSTIPKMEGSTIIAFQGNDCEYENILEALKNANLSAADMRAKMLIVFDDITDGQAINLYSALIGFAGRRVEYLYKGELYDANTIHDSMSRLEDSGKPNELVEEVFFNNPEKPLNFILEELISAEDLTKIRYSKSCIINAENTTELFKSFITISSLRFRNNTEHLPSYEVGSVVYEQESIRRASNEIRRSVKNDVRGFIAPKIESTKRVEWLQEVANTPIEKILEHLDCYHDIENDFWRCPRPERHRNGDKNPSMKISEGKIRCYRCDSENIDSLRVIMDTKGLSPDAAANYITKFILR